MKTKKVTSVIDSNGVIVHKKDTVVMRRPFPNCSQLVVGKVNGLFVTADNHFVSVKGSKEKSSTFYKLAEK